MSHRGQPHKTGEDRMRCANCGVWTRTRGETHQIDRVLGWCEGCRYAFEERAAIMEYDGEMSRPEAERHARESITR